MFVNLFIPSVLDWKEKGMKVRQETRFPASETTVLTLSMAEPVRTTFRLRYPSWSRDVQVRVNGKRVKVRQQPGSYIAIEREWKDGDRIEATYPMHLTLEAAPDNPHRAALLYGPVVLAGALGTEGMLPPAPDSDPSKYNDYYTYDYHIPEGKQRAADFGGRFALPHGRRRDGVAPLRCASPALRGVLGHS